MKRVLFCFFFACFITSATFAENTPIQDKKLEYVKGLSDFIFDTMSLKDSTKEQKITKIRKMVESEMDFEWNAKIALGSKGKTLKPEELKKFINLYKELLCQNWATKFAIAENASKKNIIFNQKVSKLNSSDDLVGLFLETRNGNKFDIKILVKTVDADLNKFKVIDLIAEGVSIATSYRTQFSSYIDQNGLDTLIAHLEKIVNKGNK